VIIKFSAAIAAAVGVVLLVVFLSTSTGEKGLLAHFDDIDATDKTPVLLRYKFQQGQKLVFECAAESITAVDDYGGRGGGIQRVETVHEFEVSSVDENGVAVMEMLLKKIVLETGGEIGHRKVEMTPDNVRVFEGEKEIEPEEEDIRVREIFPWKYKLEVTPRGKILSGTVPEKRAGSIRQLNMFLQSFFPELPEGQATPGEEYDTVPAWKSDKLIERTSDKNECLGYKNHGGRRCAVLKKSFSFHVRPRPEEGFREDREGESVTGIFFSLEDGLAPLTFMSVESEWESKSEGMSMKGSSREEAIIRLVSDTAPGK